MKKKSFSVGYGKPPKHSRFKPGQSGNPKGRPKGARGVDALLDAELKRMVSVSENGRVSKLPMKTIVIRTLVNKAGKGHPRFTDMVLAHLEKTQALSPLRTSEQAAIDKIIVDEFIRRKGGRGENGGDK